jgi:hypothetical protein
MAHPTPEELYGTGGAQPIWKPEEMRVTISPEDLYAPEPGLMDEIGQMGGGIAGGIKGAAEAFSKAPAMPPWSKPVAAIVGGGVGAFLGGGAGEGAQQVYQTMTDDPLAPENWQESTQRIFEAGGEEALYDVAGSTLFKGIGLGWKAIRPKPVEGIEDVQAILSTHGGRLSASQMTDNSLVQTIEGLVEASWGGKALRDLRTSNDIAIQNYTSDYLSKLADGAADGLSEEGLGRLFVSTIEGGRSAHGETAKGMFGALDREFQSRTQRLITPETGAINVIQPVDTSGIRKVANDILAIQQEIGGATLGDYGGAVIKKASSINDRISFKAAQELRSGLLANLRGLKGAVGEGKTQGAFSRLSASIDTAMEQAARDSGDSQVIDAWRGANGFWRKGKTLMDTEFLGKLINKNPEVIGETIFSTGNVSQIKEARRALRATAKFTRGTGEAIQFSPTWKKMQSGYLSNLIGKVSDPQTGELSVRKLKSHFVRGTPQNRTLLNAFTKEQREGLKIFVNAIERSQKRPQGAGTFMVTVGQAGLVLTGAGMGAFAGVDVTKELVGFTIAPAILARGLTNPKFARLISRGANMKAGGAQSGAVLAKIMASLGYFGEE